MVCGDGLEGERVDADLLFLSAPNSLGIDSCTEYAAMLGYVMHAHGEVYPCRRSAAAMDSSLR